MKLTKVEKTLLLLDFAKDKIVEFWRKKIFRLTIFFVALSLVAFMIFSYKPQAQGLPSCSFLDDATTPNPGVNCLYFGLPLCRNINPPSNIRHRINCADIIDLPLCSDIVTAAGYSAKPGKNCVDLCSNPAYNNPDPTDHPEWERAIDFAVHNRDCMRFCDNLEIGITANPGINCAVRKCHQLVSGVTPNDGTNCNILPCNLLTPDELNKSKFDDSTKKYCDGDNLKCYNFTQLQLPYMKLRQTNPTCIIHNCTPETPSCGADDVLNITNKGSAYAAVYQRYINSGLNLSSNSFCTPVQCRPVITSQFRCTVNGTEISGDNVRDIMLNNNCDRIQYYPCNIDAGGITTLNNSCDITGGGASCVRIPADSSARTYCYKTLSCAGNYCTKRVDCNLAANSRTQECLIASNVGEDSSSNFDPFDSWFYRPKPAAKAVNNVGNTRTNTGLINSPMSGNLCYSQSDMDNGNSGGYGWGRHPTINLGPFGTIDLGWYHNYLEFDTRSPGSCDGSSDGHRGIGYGYLCGLSGFVYDKPNEDVVYFKGYATTDFSGSVPKHKVTVCVRFQNTLTHGTCGKRECGVTGMFSRVTGKTCGADVCRELIIDEAEGSNCVMTSDTANETPDNCAGTIDTYLRVRAVRYNDKICAFFDSKGQLGYNQMFFDGSESIVFPSRDDVINPGVVCVNDSSGQNGDCHGFNSNSSEGNADKWRTIQRVNYISNNRPSGTPPNMQGYLDRSGRLYKVQPCPQITLKLPPPDLYNIATVVNSPRLFSPPISIRNAVKIRDGDDAIIPAGQIYGKTDFHYPEVRVQFGSEVFKMSLGFGYSGREDEERAENYPISPSFKTVTVRFNGRSYEARLFVRKEFFENVGKPQFCLYRKIRDQDGIEISPIRLGCVDRNSPDIDNTNDRARDPSLPFRKIVINPSADNVYNNVKMLIQYLDGGANKRNDNCSGDDKCSSVIMMSNSNYKVANCNQETESHQICVQREECSAIYFECTQNEIDLNNARDRGEDLSRFVSQQQFCNRTLVPLCNKKKGSQSISGDMYTPILDNSTIDPNAYGWFNEMCIVSGFETKLKKVIARVTNSGVRGKCLVDLNSPYLRDANPATNCDDGGRAPNCLCIEAPSGYIVSAGQEIRTQTPHEAGLCIDMPVPPFCPVISYNPTPNTDNSDPEYINSSLGKNSYDDVAGIRSNHRLRTLGVISGNADFPRALPGMNQVRGECKGFWTYSKNSSGVSMPPMQNCVDDNGSARWTNAITNRCARFVCPDVFTAGPDVNGAYQGNYANGEIGENKGMKDGFAVWQKYTKTNDFVENRSANGCIAGFKPVGSSAIRNAAGLITRYNGGTLPQRSCDQLGNWGVPTNSCVRISCGAINPPEPTSVADTALWNQWYNNGGATFPSVLASRSSIRAQRESVATGVCNNSLGFFQSPGGAAPTLECDYLGNWGVVRNPCSTACEAIADDAQASILNNGFAKWDRAIAGESGNFLSCAIGYITNPYPPFQDTNGAPLATNIANDLTRPAENPKRNCSPTTTTGGATIGVWGAVSNGCIEQCPGFDADNRVGVGVTRHPIRSAVGASTIDVNWASTNLGTYAYASNWNGPESFLNATYFQSGRTNSYYLLRRFCNNNGKWSDPEPMCSANSGQVGNARYSITTPPGYQNSLAVGSSAVTNGQCISNTWRSGRNTEPAPQRKCVYESGNNYINKVYLSLVSPTRDCETMTCPNYPGFLGDRGQIAAINNTPSDPRFLINGQITGGCLVNTRNARGQVVTTSSVTINPSVTCQLNGQGVPAWSMADESACKFGCYVPRGGDIDMNTYGCGRGRHLMHEAFTLQNNQNFTFIFHDECEGHCDTLTYGFSCNDGALSGGNTYTGAPSHWCKAVRYNNGAFGSHYAISPYGWGVIYPNGNNFINANNAPSSLSVYNWEH